MSRAVILRLQKRAIDIKGAEYLVGYWGFNEGAGDTAYDSSGHENHGALNGPMWVGSQEEG